MRDPVLRSIVAATDLSPAADAVLRTAAALAAAEGAELHLIHAFDLQLSPHPEADPAGAPTFQGRVGEAVERLEEQIRRTVPEGVRVESREVVIYVAHRAILDHAARVRADLIVLGPHRQRRVGDRLLGTTADRVIRSSEVPCLVVRGDLPLPLRRVVVALDLSEPARAALDMALDWSGALGATDPDLALPEVQVDVVHVLPSAFLPKGAPQEATVVPHLHREIEEALRRTRRGGGVSVREELIWGETPAEEIVRYAEREKTQLLVIATHGHGAVARALIGSVASAVARDAPCPVLLVPPALWREPS